MNVLSLQRLLSKITYITVTLSAAPLAETIQISQIALPALTEDEFIFTLMVLSI